MTGCKTLQEEFDAITAGLGDVVAKMKPYEEPVPGGGQEREREADGGEAPDDAEEAPQKSDG
ncbi:hypothetical protein [Nocardiopsis suaedae]|uniref:Uncharacterized protein n=1 Tax=Nocardiopsis suaedae TaxID=3018444 RepID=A0ABT4TQ45_9ACTN|nr:hypothetical protein [Nocardiopsis suaedae]MDA2806808.1 hypothetical protein [Nocardiopsis suaedae]